MVVAKRSGLDGFAPVGLKDTKFMSAAEKEKVLRQWAAFLRNGLRFQDFTEALYKHLTLHCSFIAHYDRHGFYSFYFDVPEDSIRFLRQFDRDFGCVSVEYGATWWLTDPEYRDINVAMCDIFDRCKRRLCKGLRELQRERDLAQADALLAKHGLCR